MNVFGKRRRWYLEKLARFNYISARGNSLDNIFVGRAKGIGEWIKLAASGEIIARFGFNISLIKNIPIEAIIAIPLAIWIWEFLIGLYDVKKMKLYQIEQEIQLRDRMNPWAIEQMERIKDIQRAISPKTVDKKYESYVEKQKKHPPYGGLE